jgi:hypothetical protein
MFCDGSHMLRAVTEMATRLVARVFPLCEARPPVRLSLMAGVIHHAGKNLAPAVSLLAALTV